jgi:hypothetical protein
MFQPDPRPRNAWGVILAALVFTVFCAPALAQRGDDSERASKNGKTVGSIGGVEVVVEYGRPKVKGRTIWGGVVPYDQVWRTGADEATTISFSAPVLIEGKALPAGTYALFTVPGKDQWTVVFNKRAKQWGAFSYKDSEDALRVQVKPAPAAAPVEELDFVIEGPKVVMRWEKLAVPFTVQKAS